MSESKNAIENGCTDYLEKLLQDDNPMNDTYEDSSLDEQNTSTETKDVLVKRKEKAKIVIMGLKKSGKSSISKVVFHKLSPNETIFLDKESSNKIIKDDIQTNSLLFFSIYTLPGELDALGTSEVHELLAGADALVFVIDAQDDYSDALIMLNFAVIKAYKINPNIKFEVFIHKVDCLSDDNKIEVQRDIRQRVTDELSETGNILLSFHLTSIYDHSIFEAFSKVVQKLIPQLPVLESLLNLFISTCQIEKAFLFDVVSKIYLATDSSAVDMQSYELLCDMIDVVIDLSSIYGASDMKDENELATFDGCSSSSTIKLNNQTVLYLREVNNFLALVCILREENFDKQGLIDYNFQCFKDAIEEIFTKNDEIIAHQTNGQNGEQYSIEAVSMKDDEKFFNGDQSIANN